MAITLTSSSDTPEQVREALESRGYEVEITEGEPGQTTEATAQAEKPPAPAEPEETETTETPKPADKSAAAPGAAEDTQEPPETEKPQDDKAAKPDPSPSVQKRIDKAVAKQREAERARDALKDQIAQLGDRLAALETKSPETKQPKAEEPETGTPAETKPAEDPEPALEDHESYEEWNALHQKWVARQESAPLKAEIDRLTAKIQAREESERADRERQPLDEAYFATVEKAREAHEDYDEATDQAAKEGLHATPPMHQEIYESPQGGEIVYYLARHPEECKRIAELTKLPDKPTGDQVGRAVRIAAKEIGLIEAELATPKVSETKAPETKKPRPSNAPAPVETVGTRSTAASGKDPNTDEMTPAQYREWKQRRRR